MCGIVGVCSSNKDLSGVNQKIFAQMLYADVFRGSDATGIALVDKDFTEEIIYMKEAVPSFQFLHGDAGLELFDRCESTNYFIGHNRAASMGGYSDHEAHPFDFPKVIGVHNGTVPNFKNLCEETKHLNSDSESIFCSIDKIGIEATVEKLNGSFALLYFDKEEEKIKMIRNKERPMFFSFLDDEETVIFSSEKELSGWILSRNKKKVARVVEAEPGVLYSFNPESMCEYEEKELPLFKVKTHVHISKTTYNRYDDNYYDEYVNRILGPFGGGKRGDVYPANAISFNKYNSTNAMRGELIVRAIDSNLIISVGGVEIEKGESLLSSDETILVEITGATKVNEALHVFGQIQENTLYQGRNECFVTVDQWIKETKDGCSICSSHLYLGEDIYWMGDFPVCKKCGETYEYA